MSRKRKRSRWEKATRDHIETWAFRLALILLKCIPYPLAEAMLSGISVFAGMTLGIRRQVADDNLARAFPEKSTAWRQRVLREMYANFGRTAAQIYLASSQRMLARVSTEGWEYFAQALDRGRGVLFVSAHFGNWELAAQYVARKGIRFDAIVKRQRNQVFDDYTNRLRERNGVHVIMKHGPLREIFDELARNASIAFLSDQDAGHDGMRLDFLGRPASVHTGPVRIALKTGAAIVPSFCVSKPDGSHCVVFFPAVPTAGLDTSPQSVALVTRELLDRTETMVRQYPEQWFWVHRRWKGAHKAQPVELPRKETL